MCSWYYEELFYNVPNMAMPIIRNIVPTGVS